MAVLIPDAIERPTDETPSVRAKALDDLLGRFLEWVAADGEQITEDERERARNQLDESLKWHRNGYETAKDLERIGYSPDAELVDMLDGWDGDLICAEDAAVRAWVKEVQPKKLHAVGDRIRAKYGSKVIEGKIIGGDDASALYYVRTAECKPHSSHIVKWEDVES